MDEVEQDVTGFIPFYGVAQVSSKLVELTFVRHLKERHAFVFYPLDYWIHGCRAYGDLDRSSSGRICLAEKSRIRVQLASIADDHWNDISIWQWYIVTIWFTMLKNHLKKSHDVYFLFWP